MRIVLFAAFQAVLTVAAWGQSPDGRRLFRASVRAAMAPMEMEASTRPRYCPASLRRMMKASRSSSVKAFREKACRPLSNCLRRTCARWSPICEPYSSGVVVAAEFPSGSGCGLPTVQDWKERARSHGRELQLRTDDQRIHLLRKSGNSTAV